MATSELAPSAVYAEIDATNAEIERLDLTADEMRNMLYYLTGADPRAVRDAMRFIRDSRKRSAMHAAWRSCPSAARFPTYVQHDRSCRRNHQEN